MTGADSNLLFGILAVQLDFVDRAALIEAMSAWLLAKQRPLGEILVERRALTAEQHQLLSALVAEHLRQHQGDPALSLASLSTIGDLRDDLASLDDSDVEASLSMVTIGGRSHDAAPRQAAKPGDAAEPRFKILRPHARGGLGRVFVARDAEVNRDVALKELLDEHADDAGSRQRFLREAEITGRLEHPGIVPVYGLGAYADGRPFYAMRFIRGDSLHDAIARFHAKEDRDEIEFRRLLRRFLDVCNAIHYAHSRKVLHRDLKPGNIMLGEYGETLVVDWGLAKPVEHPAPPAAATPDNETLAAVSSLRIESDSFGQTEHGQVLGTPAYMSPEQAAGRLGELGPASDVYSLGATLFCLLTGKLPVEGTNNFEVLDRVRQGKLRRPREVDSRVPAPLESICLKSLARRPEDRYASALQLAEEIENWLADEPVAAHRETRAARMARWMRKHKGLTQAAAATLVAIAAASSVGAVLVEAQRRRADRAYRLAEEARKETDRAHDRLQTLVFREGGAPAVMAIIEELLTAEAARLDALSKAQPGGQSARSRAELHERVGDLYARLDRSASDRALAMKEFEASLALREELARTAPKVGGIRLELAEAKVRLAGIKRGANRTAEARQLYKEAADLLEQLTKEEPADVELWKTLVSVYDALLRGPLPWRREAASEALQDKRRAAAAALVRLAPTPELLRETALYDSLQGDRQIVRGEVRQARESYQKSHEVIEQIAKKSPGDPALQRNLADSFWRLGDASWKLGDVAAARRHFEQELGLREAEARSGDAKALERLSDARLRLAEFYATNKDLAAEERCYMQDYEMRDRLAKTSPQDDEAQKNVAWSLGKLGGAAQSRNELAKAIEYYERALAILHSLDAGGKLAFYDRTPLADIESSLNECREMVDEETR